MMNKSQTDMSPDHPNAGRPLSNGLFTLYSASDLMSFPEMSWLIDEVLPKSGLACVYGPSGVGKSFLCLDIAASVAGGLPWFGHQTTQTKVVYIALEGQAGFSRRIAAWKAHRGIPFPGNVKFVTDRFALNNPDHPPSLSRLIDSDGSAGLIIIDTLNKSAPAADENSSVDMGRILAGASTLQEVTGGLVLLIHHPGKDGSRGLRGHSSLPAALDTIIEVQRNGELVQWKLAKSKDGEDGISHCFKLITLEVGQSSAGKKLKSCAVEEAEGTCIPIRQSEPRGTNQQLILTTIKELLIAQRVHSALTDSGQPDGLPLEAVLLKVRDVLQNGSARHRKLRAEEALEGLISKGFLILKEGLLALPITKT